MYTKTGNSAYSSVSLDSQIAGATPHQLIVCSTTEQSMPCVAPRSTSSLETSLAGVR